MKSVFAKLRGEEQEGNTLARCCIIQVICFEGLIENVSPAKSMYLRQMRREHQ